jgi:hypothetical protein
MHNVSRNFFALATVFIHTTRKTREDMQAQVFKSGVY